MKTSHTMYIYRQDRRYKTGERLFSTTVWHNRDAAEMAHEARELKFRLYFGPQWRFECVPTTRTVTNLMTGAAVEIAHDTPWCCNPASETYWSM